MISNAKQRSLDWYRCRLSCVTGSNVGLLMKSGRGGLFSDTAKAYLYQLAGERLLNPEMVADDALFGEYLQVASVESKAMRFGTEQEGAARALYAKMAGEAIVEVSLCRHPSIPNFASSPDGFYVGEAGQRVAVEIKCPSLSTFMKYRDEIHDNDSLLRVKPEYFYQCMAHIMCVQADCCDFIVYCPFVVSPIHSVRILPDGEVFEAMEARVRMANDIIGQIADI